MLLVKKSVRLSVNTLANHSSMIYRQSKFRDFFLKYIPHSDEYQYDVEIIPNPSEDYIEDFFKKLKAHKDYEKIKDNFIYDADMNMFAQIHERIPNAEVADLTQEEAFFYPWMNKAEIKRIFNIQNSSDYLLRLRAEQIEQNIRLKRLFSSLQKKFGAKWSFTKHFDSKQYQHYLKHLSPAHRAVCANIPHGTIHSDEANGMCMPTPFGNIISLSYALRYFLYYMNLFYFGDELEIKGKDRNHAFLIGVRVMLGKESLDFELDTRGRLPKSINTFLNRITDWQMRFVIGHEYAHHYLGHLKTDKSLKMHTRIFDLPERVQRYTYKQQQEFEADLNSIINTSYEDTPKGELINGAFLFFNYLDMCYAVADYMFPGYSRSNVHPLPLDRLVRLRKMVDPAIGPSKEQLDVMIQFNKSYMDEFLKEYLPFNVEQVETEGSIYLPGYRKKILIDRLDF